MLGERGACCLHSNALLAGFASDLAAAAVAVAAVVSRQGVGTCEGIDHFLKSSHGHGLLVDLEVPLRGKESYIGSHHESHACPSISPSPVSKKFLSCIWRRAPLPHHKENVKPGRKQGYRPPFFLPSSSSPVTLPSPSSKGSLSLASSSSVYSSI